MFCVGHEYISLLRKNIRISNNNLCRNGKQKVIRLNLILINHQGHPTLRRITQKPQSLIVLEVIGQLYWCNSWRIAKHAYLAFQTYWLTIYQSVKGVHRHLNTFALFTAGEVQLDLLDVGSETTAKVCPALLFGGFWGLFACPFQDVQSCTILLQTVSYFIVDVLRILCGQYSKIRKGIGD